MPVIIWVGLKPTFAAIDDGYFIITFREIYEKITMERRWV